MPEENTILESNDNLHSATKLCKFLLKAHKCMLQVYIELGLPQDTKLCVFIYGGQPPGEWELRESNLPEGWVCVVCSGGKPILSDKQLPVNFRLAKPDDFIPDMVCQICPAVLHTFTQAAAHVSPMETQQLGCIVMSLHE